MLDTFRVLDATVDNDRREWEELWDRSASRLPYAHPGVVGQLERGRGNHLALAMEWQDTQVLYPIVLRGIGDGLNDVTSPYGYGGALVSGDGPVAEISRRFWGHFDDWARDQRVVSEFVRLSLFPDVLPHPGQVRRRSTNYVRELTPDREAVWSGSEAKVRQNVRRALRSGLTVRIAEDTSLLADFERIYLGTMERLGSAPWYRFGHDFFSGLCQEYAGRLLFVAAEQEGRPVSVDFLLLGRDTAFYFLGGTDLEATSSRPNDLVKMTVMEELAERGYRSYVLGGGLHAGDGLERYKRGFAPRGEVDFCTAERILDPRAYAALTAQHRDSSFEKKLGWDEHTTFFPAYRAPLPSPEPTLASSTTGGTR